VRAGNRGCTRAHVHKGSGRRGGGGAWLCEPGVVVVEGGAHPRTHVQEVRGRQWGGGGAMQARRVDGGVVAPRAHHKGSGRQGG